MWTGFVGFLGRGREQRNETAEIQKFMTIIISFRNFQSQSIRQ